MIPVLDHAGKPELIYPALVASIAIGFAIRGYWELRVHLWFWCAIITIATIHALLILSMNWRTGWVPGSALMLFAIVDFALILGIIGLLKRLVGSSESRGS